MFTRRICAAIVVIQLIVSPHATATCESALVVSFENEVSAHLDQISQTLTRSATQHDFANEQGAKLSILRIDGKDRDHLRQQVLAINHALERKPPSFREFFARSLSGTYLSICTAVACAITSLSIANSIPDLRDRAFAKMLMLVPAVAAFLLSVAANRYYQKKQMQSNALAHLRKTLSEKKDDVEGTTLFIFFSDNTGAKVDLTPLQKTAEEFGFKLRS